MVEKPIHKEFEQIVDKSYQLENLINMDDLKKLLEDFHKIAPFPVAVLNLKGDVLIESHWEPICTRFHRVNPKTAAICAESDIHFNAELAKSNESHILYRCANGLYDAASPIIIEGQHLGNFFIGQFLLEPPDEGFFRKQAQRYGFEEEEYLEALSRVPIISEHGLKNRLDYLCGFAEFIGNVGLKEFQRDRAQEALRESEEGFRYLADASMEAIFFTKEGVCLEANQVAAEMFGYDDRSEFIGMFGTEIIAPESHEIVKEHMVNNILEPYEAVGERKNGTRFPISIRAKAMPYKAKGIVRATSIIDISDRKQAEAALQKSEEKFRTVFDTSPHAIALTETRTGKLIDVNDKLCQLSKYTKNELIDRTTTQLGFYSEDDRNRFVNELTNSGKVHNLEMDFKVKDGSIINTHMFAIPIQFEGETLVLTEFHDVTEQKRSDRALWESEKRYRRIFENIQDVYYESSLDGTILETSPSIENVSQYKREELIGASLYDIYTNPKERDEFLKLILDKGKVNDFEISLTDKDGSQRPCSITTSLVKDEQNNPIKLVGSMRDISERKQSEERFRLTFDTSPDAINVNLLENGLYVDVNDGFTQLTGYTREDVIGRTSLEINIWHDTGDRQKLVNGLQEKGYYENLEAQFVRKDGSLTTALMSAKIISLNGIPHIISITRDISDLKIAEAAKQKLQEQLHHAQKMEAIGLLAGGVAHDLNNILGGLVSYPELLLLQLPLDSPLRKSILTIQKSGEKAAAVVQDLLTLARRGVVVTEVVNLNDVISEYLESPEHMTLQSYHPGVHIETHFEEDALNILGSSAHLSKSVMNLVSNAAEAMPEGGALTVSTENRHLDRPIRGYDHVKEGDYVVLKISDTGTGISSDDLEKIFEPFYTKKKMGRSGTGLGMAVVWGTVKDHNGYIDVQSTEGKGTTFTLHFPVTRKSIEERSEISLEDYMGKSETILVVDDVEEQRNIASGMLKELGYSVVSVSSGEEAVEYLKANKADLLLLDMIMDPGMDGLDTYKKILETHPRQKAIIASGFSETDRARKLQHLGAGAYIRKPFLLEKIGIAIKEELEK